MKRAIIASIVVAVVALVALTFQASFVSKHPADSQAKSELDEKISLLGLSLEWNSMQQTTKDFTESAGALLDNKISQDQFLKQSANFTDVWEQHRAKLNDNSGLLPKHYAIRDKMLQYVDVMESLLNEHIQFAKTNDTLHLDNAAKNLAEAKELQSEIVKTINKQP